MNTASALHAQHCASATFAAIATALVAGLAPTTMAGGDVIYENDFATRSSAGAVPYGEWRTVTYSAGTFLADDYNSPFAGSAFQDNWIRGRNSCNCPTHIVDDNGNPEVVMHNAADNNKHVIIKHRIGNTFTSGTVTAQCDFRAPTTWTGYSLVQDMALGDERFFSPETDTSNGGGEYLNYRAAQAGVIHDGSVRKFTNRESSGPVKENTTLANATSWYRLVLSVNLDTRKYSCTFYDLGMEHPTLETPTPATAAFTKSGIDMPSAAVSSISAIAIDCYSPHGGSDTSSLDLSQTGQFDNLRVSHNGVECYVNDFATRRSRALYGTMTATYAADVLVTNAVGTEMYVADSALYPARIDDRTISQPVGVDGWRRINSDLWQTPTVYSDGGNQTMFFDMITGVAAVTIGQTLRTGKVRVSADVHATGIGGQSTGQGVYVHIGSDAFYTANYQQYSDKAGRFGSVGIVGTSTTIDGSTYRRPCHVTSSGTVYGTGDEWVKQVTWLRFTIEADLDAGTYAVTIRDQGTAHPTGDSADGETVYYSKSGMAKIDSSVDSISSVGLASFSSNVMFDNVRIWHRPTGAAAETLVYDNRFNPRTIYYQDMKESRIVGLLAKEPVGQDGWTRLNVGTMQAVVRDNGGNPSLTFGDGKDNLVYAVHDIGTLCKSGKIISQVDACPPVGWRGASRAILLWLGGDKFHEGNLKNSDEVFYKWAALMVGFRDAAGATGAGGVYTNVTLCAYNGDGVGGGAYVDSGLAVNPSHWYRFVATSRLADDMSDIAVYDMGATHPTPATATPDEPVATFADVKFRMSAANLGGVSSLGISAMGAMDNTVNETVGAYWDNIQIRYRPQNPFTIVVR